MKSKRRHELQTNELADQLGQWIDKVRPHLATIGLVVLACAAILVVWYYWASGKEQLVTQSWRAYLYAGSNPQGDMIEELRNVADDFADTPAGVWAAQTAADLEGGQAVRMLFGEKATGEKNLDVAIEEYERVLSNELTKKSRLLETRAHFGLAQTLEAKGELEDAIKHYETVAKANPDSALGKAAQGRIDRLSEKETQEWYAWFAKQVPVTRKPDMGLDPGDDLGGPATNLDIVPDGPGSGFMAEEDTGGVMAPPKSTEGDGTEASKPEEAGSTSPAKKEAEEAGDGAPSIDGPKIDGPAVEPPESEPAKESPTGSAKKEDEVP